MSGKKVLKDKVDALDLADSHADMYNELVREIMGVDDKYLLERFRVLEKYGLVKPEDVAGEDA